MQSDTPDIQPTSGESPPDLPQVNGSPEPSHVPLHGGFPIVGIGASAGGLAAFESFFRSLPPDSDCDMAFVLVQHLAPDHKSKSKHGYPSQLQTAKWQKLDEVVRLTFSDDGHGMDDAIVKRIFEPFFTTKPIDQGTGLGLAVVHRIVSTHDGEITVKSQLGQGTTFTIYFPPALATQIDSSVEESPIGQQFLASHLPAEANSSQRYPQRSILYLDDEPMVLNSMIKLLGHAGLQVHGYSDQQTALNFLHSAVTRVDVVVTDYNMPGLSGLDVAKKIREIRPDLPVIIASGFIDEELRSQAEEAGVKALISKPFSTKTFCELVQQLSPPSN